MKKLLISAATLACGFTLLPQAHAEPPTPTPTPQAFSAQVEIIDQSGSHTFPVTASGETLSSFLKDKGLKLSQYRYGDNQELKGSDPIAAGENEKLYKISAEGTSEIIDLPAPLQEVESNELLIGATQVKEEGTPGKMLKTVVTNSLSGSTVSQTSETLIVLEAPKAKVVLKGTKQPPAPKLAEPEKESSSSNGESSSKASSKPAPSKQGVDAPAASTSSIEDTSSLVSLLKAQVGKPYVWGSEGPDSFDCSGLVYYVLNKSGHNLPRVTASDYGSMATPVAMSNIQPGDIFWTNSHIGIYVGNGKVIHAANPTKGVIVSDVSYFTSSGFQLARLP